MKSAKIGGAKFPDVWVFDINSRAYDANRRSIYRAHWRKVKIAGETSRSWVTNRNEKISKKGGRGIAFSQDAIDRDVWINDNKHRLSNEIIRCDDYELLRRVDELLAQRGTEEQSEGGRE